jgi:hypothetical protein
MLGSLTVKKAKRTLRFPKLLSQLVELALHGSAATRSRRGRDNTRRKYEIIDSLRRAAARGAPMEAGLGRRGVGAGPCRALVAVPGAWVERGLY